MPFLFSTDFCSPSLDYKKKFNILFAFIIGGGLIPTGSGIVLMGATCSSAETSDSVTKLLDAQLKMEKEKERMHFKILCLGAGESGKSTVIKQLEALYVKSHGEPREYIKTLQSNSVDSINVFTRAAVKMGKEFTESEQVAVDGMQALAKSHDEDMLGSAVGWMDIIRESAAFKHAWDQRNTFWNLEASKFFFDNFKRFVGEEFVPTDEDIIMARKRTTGVIETTFDKFDIKWTVVDVGGQRNERRKWINCFDDVHAILYVVNLAGTF